jgi:hypothetical protein
VPVVDDKSFCSTLQAQPPSVSGRKIVHGVFICRQSGMPNGHAARIEKLSNARRCKHLMESEVGTPDRDTFV